MSFFDRLESRARQVNSLLCVGLDPHPVDLPEYHPEAARDFCLKLIDSTADLVAAFKPNAAFFEAFGAEGLEVLKQVIKAVPEEIPVILDVKRGDIASTARAYAQAAFQTLGADAITVNPYLGYDAVEPFLEDPERGVFLLCKTSNPGARDFQDLMVSDDETGGEGQRKLFEQVALWAKSWNQKDNLGLVVGATQIEALAAVRELARGMWILAPGIGAQGGDLKAALSAGLRKDGLGLLAPVSRGIARSADPRQTTLEIREAINRHRDAGREKIKGPGIPKPGLAPLLAMLADELLEAGCIQFGEFTLKSGLKSPIYIDLRRLVGFPGLLQRTARAYISVLRKLTFDSLAALPYAAMPIATAISLQGGWPMIYPRKEVKAYGTRAQIEGVFQPGEQVAVIDDLTTTGGSKFEAIEKLTGVGLKVQDVVVLIDRQSGATQALSERGYSLHAVFTMIELLNYWQHTRKVPLEQIETVRVFLDRTVGG